MKHGCPCVICSGKDPLRSLGAHENRITVEPHWMYFEGAETTKVWDLDGDFWVTDGDGVLFVDSWPWSFRIQDWGNLCCLLVWFGTCDVLRYLDFWLWSARIAITLAFLIPSFPNFIATPLTPGELEDSAICRKKNCSSSTVLNFLHNQNWFIGTLVSAFVPTGCELWAGFSMFWSDPDRSWSWRGWAAHCSVGCWT